MPISVLLIDEHGHQQRGLADPSGGTFDAAGDFDRLLGLSDDFPVWSTVDTEGDTRMTGAEVVALAEEVEHLRPRAKAGPESRGLDRLRVMAERCRDDDRLALLFVGD